jgi:uncharacterized protein involved in outer membrane biogenesis
MSPSVRRKLLIGVGGFVGLLVVALLLAPTLIDLDGRKPQIIAEVKKATGRDLEIAGPISLSLFPTPTVTVSDVVFHNMPGASNPRMVELKTVTVKPALLPLLSGNIELSEVALVDPKIVLEINAQGKPNWEFTPSVEAAKPAAPAPGSPRPLSLGRVVIENGTLLFSDAKAGIAISAEKANFVASVGSLDGPYALRGDAVLNGGPLKLDLAVGAKAADGHSLALAFEASGGALGFKGTLSELGPNARLAGAATVSAEQLATFVGTLAALAGQPAPQLPMLVAGKFSFDGEVDVSQSAFAAKSFKLKLGDSAGSGSLSVALKPSLAIDGKVTVPRLDFDQILASLAQPPAATGAPVAAVQPKPATPTTSGGGIPSDLDAKVALEVGELVYNKAPVRNVVVELEAKGGAIAVPRLSATLPGDMALQARSTMTGDPARPSVSGDFSLVGPDLRQTLAWLAVDVSSVPPNKLSRLSLKGRMASTGGNVDVRDAVFELDDVKGSGGIVVTFGVPLSIVTRLDIDTLNLDSYLARPAGGAKPAAKPAASSAAPAPSNVAPPSIGLKAKVAKLIYSKETIGGVDVDVALQGTTLKLNDIKVSNLGGARLAVRGSVANYDAAMPRAEIAFNFEAPDMSRVLKVAGATAPAGLGAVTASGGVAGTVELLTMRELNVSAMGQSVRAIGTLALPGASRGAPQSAAYKGSVTLNGQTIEGSVDARFAGKPTINADLHASVLDLDRLTAPGRGGGAAPARGQPAPAAKSTAGPLDGVDGSLKLAAATLISGSNRIGNADLAATLKDGVLTIAHFRGTMHGGSVAFSGVVDGGQPAMSFDLKGDASNISIGEMLRSSGGSNTFGGTVKVTVDGRLNATNISVRGAGATADQIKRSLAGSAHLGGYVHIGADKALTTLGTAATGVVGGVIDNTLGSALGIVGQKGGVGVGNILNAISLILNRFVNHNNPISGQIDIAGGVLSDRGLVVQGNRATANISTRTNLANSTTDTTVRFFIAEDSSSPYLITTARGPTSNPSYNVTRGTAKDPPGMVNTLTDAVTNPLTGGGQGRQQQRQQQQQQQQQQQRSIIPNLPIPNFFGR